MRVYYEITKIALKNSIVYRLDLLISIVGSILALFVQIYLWKALLGNTSVDGVTINDMITYKVIGILISLLYVNSVAGEVGSKVVDGSISMELIKPYNFALSMLFRTLGDTISGFIIKGIPVIIIVLITLHFKMIANTTNLLLMSIVIPLNILIFWLMHYIIGLMHFILINAGWFVRILKDTIRILGGGIIPLWFFPQTLKQVSLYLPFQLLYQFPQSLFINKINTGQIFLNIILQILWIIILVLISVYLWLLGVKRLVIQGG